MLRPLIENICNSNTKKFLLLVNILLLAFSFAFSNPVIIDKTSEDFLIPSSSLRILKDDSGTLSIEDILSTSINNRFVPITSEKENQFNSVYWTHFTLINSSGKDKNWILQLSLHSEDARVYVYSQGHLVDQFMTGQAYNFDTRPIGLRTIAYELPHHVNTPIEIYIRLYSKKHSDFSFVVSSEKRYLEVHTKGYLFLGIVYGVLILMAIYNFILFLSIKERIYLFYVLYTLSCIFFISWKDGLGFQFIWPDTPFINQYHHSLGLILLLTAFLLYAKDFLLVKEDYPLLNKITYVVMVINAIYFLFNVFNPSFFDPLPFIYILSYFYILGLAVFYIKNQYKPAYYLLFSSLCLISALVTIKLRYMGLLDWNWFVEYILNYSVAIECLIMSLAIKDKIAYLRLQKEKAQEARLLKEKLKEENQQVKIKNETLVSEVVYKNNELATLSTNLTQKAEFLNQIKKELDVVLNEMHEGHPALKRIIKNIEKEVNAEDSWEQFQLNFDKVHGNFLADLRDTFPVLKQSDLLLCAYIKMGKSNKEIASLLNITVGGVDKKRQRLKEKLNMDSELKLTDFILNYKTSSSLNSEYNSQ